MKIFKQFLGLTFIVTIFIVACSDNEATNNEVTKLKVADFKEVGVIHNQFLTNVKNNFNPDQSITDLDEKIDYVTTFNKNFVNNLEIDASKKLELTNYLEEHKNLVLEENVVNLSFGINNQFSKTVNEEPSLFDLIEQLKKEDKLSDKSYVILNSLTESLKLNYENVLSDIKLKENVENLINEFDNHGFVGEEAEMVGTILAISISSIEWWEENPDALDGLAARSELNQKSLIAPWLATDIGGAIIGGVYAGVVGNSWRSAAYGALGGAVFASTGAAGRLGRWLFRVK